MAFTKATNVRQMRTNNVCYNALHTSQNTDVKFVKFYLWCIAKMNKILYNSFIVVAQNFDNCTTCNVKQNWQKAMCCVASTKVTTNNKT